MLPVKDLVYPGAVEDHRSFDEPVNGRTVDGNPIDNPAELRIYYRPEGDLDIDPIRTWYRERLTEDGWTTTDFDDTEKDVVLETVRDGLKHQFIVESIGAADEFVVRYQIEPA